MWQCFDFLGFLGDGAWSGPTSTLQSAPSKGSPVFQTYSSLTTGMEQQEKENICQLNSYTPSTRGSINFFAGNESTSVKAFAIRVTIWLSLEMIHCHSPRSTCLLHRSNRRVECGCDGNPIPECLKSLMVALMSAIPAGIQKSFI